MFLIQKNEKTAIPLVCTTCLRTGGETNDCKKLASFHIPGMEMLPNSLKCTTFKLESINPTSSNSYRMPVAHEE